MLSRRVLSREEESQTTDAEVTRSDQDQINRFSSLHSRSKTTATNLDTLQSKLSDLNDLSSELELKELEATDDDGGGDDGVLYKIGDSFFKVDLSEAQEMLEAEKGEVEKEIEALESEKEGLEEEMGKLKGVLYARFGRGINLEV